MSNDTMVEAKYTLSVAKITLDEGIRNRKIMLWKINTKLLYYKDIIPINIHDKFKVSCMCQDVILV